MIFSSILNFTILLASSTKKVDIYYPKGANRSYPICFGAAVRGGKPQLHELRRASAVTSARELFRLNKKEAESFIKRGLYFRDGGNFFGGVREKRAGLVESEGLIHLIGKREKLS